MKKFLFALAVWAALPLHGWAWGVEGHRAIGIIAENHLTDKARRMVMDLLGSQSLAMVSTIPDEMRYLPEFKETGPWHYVNTALGLAHDPYLAAVKAQVEPNAYNVLLLKIKEMKDPAKTREQRAEALTFVVHIVGDIHQPMHTGRAEDKGGNDIKLTYRGKDTNLHSLWDSGLLDYQGLTYTELGTQYSPVPATLLKTWQATTSPAEWLFESYTIAGQLYTEAAQNANLDYRYYPAHASVVKQRIQQAGVRLAAVLNEAFK
ncbi:S1/P1 nuclease [Hymenobacter sp. H14-R3]|uniref:S1/P1 nuclease n=1 Tax=Hymenobacter sp. H14-R3 TaxID=3046308 RepID=UPI0024B9D578|nr:S1/P1 nuclease [Hymenobacter sp. H14-R3]MDJ0364336.1 S1/P1 nuclease [Hymenobacter sp. H14-R3]